MFHEQDSIADPRDLRVQELVDTIKQQTSRIEEQAARIEELEEKRKQLQALLETKAQAKAAKKPVFTES
jgi:ABC-type phosphate transport system auxiliary subunit